ncbi:MAG TPA: hypothetical protein VLR94_11105, partial [Acidobacteriota bacterium]|nr:hypothetical protein [Acidobacteriota bacterium]
VEKMGMTGINSILTRLTFRFSLLKRAYTRPEFEQFFSKARFRSLKVEENLIGLEVSAQK